MSSRVTTSAASKTSQSNNSQRRQRSRSTSRYADLEKPKKKKTLSTATSLVSIPNTIKLSMLNSGLLSFEKVKLEARDANNSLSQTIPDKPIELRHFIKLCEQRRKFPVLYKLEFQTAVKTEANSHRHASRKNNEEKNQNQKCIPYDYNRVVLEKQGRTPDSDYVNASYVDSLLKPNAYIVTQGPTEETVNDFWRMIWQEKVSAIIMLTKTFDFTKVMCMQYWPPALDKKERYGDIHIGIDNEEQLANFHIRTFRIWKQDIDGKLLEQRHILQFHYTEWHSHTCPFSNAVLEFRRRVRSVVGTVIDANSVVGPMLVHCNDGGGRSGVYMAIDANLELAEEEDCFHVFGYLKKIRQSRRGLIENVDQYKFVYDTLEEHIVCGKTWFSVSELSERLKAKARKNPATKMNQYQEEYAQICKQTPRFTIGDCAGGHRADNRDKNRDVLCVPPDNFRPYLTSFQGNAFTDYINAVFVDGYTKPREYIVTEWPLKHTVGEFWSLVYDQECSAVVVLLQPPPNSTTYPSFWPEKSKMEKYGPVFSVHSVSRKHFTNIKQWEYKINKKIVSLTELMAGVKAPTKTVQLFQLTCFPLGHKVPTSTNSLVALMNMVENWRAKTDYGPVCVVSPDGRSRAGVYCAANACIEQVIQHGEVDIFQAVKTVRRQRPQLVENMMEYKYCYDLVLHYVLHYLNKDLKEKKFIEFGRGKAIPLSPDSSAADGHDRPNTTGKIVVNKRIAKQDVNIDAMLMTQTSAFGMGHAFGAMVGEAGGGNGRNFQQQQQLMQRKKKGRLYSLGGNEPVKGRQRGRLDRLKTVGTFDLGMEMSTLGQVARSLNAQIIQSVNLTELVEGEALEMRNAANSKDRADDIVEDSNKCTDNRELSEALPNVAQRNVLQRRKDDEAEAKHNYNKIELDMQSIEDISKCCEPPASNVVPITSSLKKTTTFATQPRKPILRKSKHLTRTDSGESLHHSQPPPTRTQYPTSPVPSPNYRHEIVLQANYDIQIHQEPLRDESDDLGQSISANTSPPTATTSATKASTSTVDTASSATTTPHCSSSRIESSDLDEAIGSPSRERIYKSADECSQNMSADDIDTVFSDTNELEQLEREYRDILRSNLQREYKSDGDTLDEVGKKRTEFTTWKNQSFENTFEMYSEINPDAGVSSASTGTRNMCNTSTANTSETGSSSKMSDPTFKIKPILKTTSSRESTMSSPAQSSPRPTQLKIDTTTDEQRPRSPPISSETKKDEAKSALSLFEKRFGKMRRINNLLKCKRFSTSALYEKKAAATKSAAETANSTDTESGLRFSPSDKPSSGESKTSLSSSKLSLFNYRGGRGFFSKRKPSMSNTELNELKPKPIQRTRLTTESYTKSFSDIQGYVPPAASVQPGPSSRQGSRLFGSGQREATVPPSAPPMLYRQPLHSPLSEEFYNPTGSCRLSAMELFEKFCSHDFGGLYKNEVTLNLERRGGTCGEYPPSLHEYRLGQRGLGVTQKYNRINDSRLLRQKSEPKFSFRDDAANTTYFEEEDDEDGNVEEEEEEEGDEYEDEYGDEFELEEEAEEEEDVDDGEEDLDVEEDFIDEENGGASEVYDDRNAGECIPPHSVEGQPETVAVADQSSLAPQYSSDVDEIFLMPAHTKCTEDYGDEYGFENKQFTLEHTLMSRTTSIDVDMGGPSGPSHDHHCGAYDQQMELRTFTLPQNVRVVREQRSGEDGDEVLTIYKMCSKDDILSIASPQSQPDDQHTPPSKSKSLAQAVEEYVQNAPVDLVEMPDTIGPVAADQIYRTDCLSSTQITPTSRSDSLDMLSSPSCTILSANTLTYPENAISTATVQHLPLNLDTCSTASRLSLSLKSEIFDDLILTPDEERGGAAVEGQLVAGVAKSCEFEDFRLTPDDSWAADVSNGADVSMTSREMNSVVDKFLQLELAEESRSPSIEEDTEETDGGAVAAATEAIDLTTRGADTEVVSAFTTEITRQFDELFSRALLDEAGEEMTESRVELNQTTDTTQLPYDNPSNGRTASSPRNKEPGDETNRMDGNAGDDADSSSGGPDPAVTQTSSLHRRMPTRYSMQMLEPYLFVDTVNGRKFAGVRPCPGNGHGNGNGSRSCSTSRYCPLLSGRQQQPRRPEAEAGGVASADGNGGPLLDGSFVPKRIIVSQKLQSNRSQSLGNLSNKTRCFPL